VSDLGDALLAGSRAAPNLDPSMIYGIAATAPDPSEVPTNAAATEALGQMTKRVAWLKSEDAGTQTDYWSAATDSERGMLAQVGYQPPAPKHGHGGLLSGAAHLIGGVANLLYVEPAKELAAGVGEALHLAGAGLRGVQHVYRADWRMWDVTGPDSGKTDSGRFFSPHEWAIAWRETSHGERAFSPTEEVKVRKRYDPATADLAKQIAGGTPPDAIVMAAPEADRLALAQRLQSDPDLKAAVADYNAIKYTLGKHVLGPALQKQLTVTLPKSTPFMGGAEVNPVSGGIDATFDWYADPVVIGGKLAKGSELARYAINGPGDVARLSATNPNVQRAIEDAATALRTGGAAALIERWPRLAPVAEQLVQEGVDTPEKLTEWFKGQAGTRAILEGRATGVSHAIPQMLKLNPREAVMLELKGGLKRVIDWAADSPLGVATATGDVAEAGRLRQFTADRLQGFGKITRQATSLTARGTVFDPLSDSSITTIQRLATYVLPADRVRDVVNLWAAAPDIASKRQVYKALLNEMFDAAGVTASEQGRSWASKFTSQIDDAVTKPIYSASGADSVLRDGTEARRGLLEPHLTTEWQMPPFKDLWAQSKRANTLGRVYQGTVNADGISTFMESVWKPSMLLRLGFPIRAGGEELVAAIMREGPMGLIRGRAAAGATKGELLGEADRLAPVHPLAATWKRLSGHLPDELVARIDQPADYIGAVYGDRARRAFRSVEARLAGEDYLAAARELWRRGPLQASFLAEVSAVEARAGGYLDDTGTVMKTVKEGSSARPAYFAPVGGFTKYKPGETLYTAMWHKNLSEIADSQLGRAALEHIDDPQAAVQAVQDTLQSPGFQKMAARADRTLYTTDGRVVGVDATREDAMRDWAQAVVDHVNSLVRDGDGAVIGDLPARLAAGDVPTVAGLGETPVERMPDAVKGREVVPVSRNWARDLMDRGFQHVVGRPMDWMVRQPLFIHNYALAQQEAEVLRPLYTEALSPVVFHGSPNAELTRFEALPYSGPRTQPGVDRLARLGPNFADSPDVARRFAEMQTTAGSGEGAVLERRIAGKAARFESADALKAEVDRLTAQGIKEGAIGTRLAPAGGADVTTVVDRTQQDAYVRDKLTEGGVTHIVHPNATDGGVTYIVLDPKAIRPAGAAAGSEFADQALHDVAMERAINKTLPFIHDPQMRSQMSVVTRNLAPFWFAQEQFYKRWAKILEHSPEAFRQAQLVMMGLRHSGVLHTDDQGNDYFMYPGSAAVQNTLTSALERLPGQKGKWKLPLPVGFSGQVRFATPGLERLGAPSFGPLVAIPMTGLTQMFPELQQTQQAVLGERGSGRSYWEMVTPTTVARLVHIATDSPDTSPQMASAMSQAIQYLSAAGYFPPEDAPPQVHQQYQDRVRNWTRILFLNRMLYGYAVPASPELQMDPDQMSSEFRGLLQAMPIEDAQAEFVRRHPDGTPYTVFQSKSQSGAPLPATVQTVGFMNDHQDFLKSYPLAGGWFLPQTSPDSKFDIVAYREQLALELRQRKSPEQFMKDVYYAQAADQYFRSRDRKEAALTAAKGDSRRTQAIGHQWDQWKADYLSTHPVFAAELQAPDAEIRRQGTVDELRRAMDDPRLPKSDQTDSIRHLIDGYDQVDGALRQMSGFTGSVVTRRRKAIRDSFAQWGDSYSVQHPEVKTLWTKTFKPLVETS
jgi:hypothetical protein